MIAYYHFQFLRFSRAAAIRFLTLRFFFRLLSMSKLALKMSSGLKNGLIVAARARAAFSRFFSRGKRVFCGGNLELRECYICSECRLAVNRRTGDYR